MGVSLVGSFCTYNFPFVLIFSVGGRCTSLSSIVVFSSFFSLVASIDVVGLLLFSTFLVLSCGVVVALAVASEWCVFLVGQ